MPVTRSAAKRTSDNKVDDKKTKNITKKSKKDVEVDEVTVEESKPVKNTKQTKIAKDKLNKKKDINQDEETTESNKEEQMEDNNAETAGDVEEVEAAEEKGKPAKNPKQPKNVKGKSTKKKGSKLTEEVNELNENGQTEGNGEIAEDVEEKDESPKDETTQKGKRGKKAAPNQNKPKATKNIKEAKASKKEIVAEDDSNKEEDSNKDVEEQEANSEVNTIYHFTANSIKGEPIPLEKYKGHVCIIVNVASKCGHTKSNYEQFVKLYEDYGESKGLKILAFPCNQFSSQEPGDNEQIYKFAEERNVKFDMFEKINVNGKNAHPLWEYLRNKIKGPHGANIKWNFTKFIIDKEGQPVERFTPATKPITLVETLNKYW